MIPPRSLAFWPEGILSADDFVCQWRSVEAAFRQRVKDHALPEGCAEELAGIYLPLAAWLHTHRQTGLSIIGINGAQGTGKTTLCDFVGWLLGELHGDRIAAFSLDDLYKTRAERALIAHDIHPLFMTRGVPGTHDIGLGLETLAALATAGQDSLTALPAFNKAVDDRRPRHDWPMFRGRPDIVLLEGWCVGSMAQPPAELTEPVNELERLEDGQGIWRSHVNQQLATDYTRLWDRLDRLVMVTVPDMASVLEWRTLQETKLAARTTSAARNGLMSPEAIRRFIMHYERLTRHTLQSLPSRADVVLTLDTNHRFAGARINASDASRA